MQILLSGFLVVLVLASLPHSAWCKEQQATWFEPLKHVFHWLQVKVLYVRNVSPNVTEEQLKEKFQEYGTVEKAKKVKDYAFVHFNEREDAIKAMEALNNVEMDGITLEIALAKPQPANKERRQGGQSGRGGQRGGPRGGHSGRGRGAPYGDRHGHYEGYDQGYDDYYGGGGGYGGGYGYRDSYGGGYGDGYYDDYSGGYGYGDRYGEAPRGGRGGPPRPPRGSSSGRGPMRGGGFPGRGGRGGPRGGPSRGGRGGRGGPRGGGVAPGKRKYGADSLQTPVEYPDPKRRYMGQGQGGGWGSQPIAQQPLYDSGYGNQSNQEWYSDSYGGQW